MLNEFCLKHPRVASVHATMSCLNRCLPNPKLLINFTYLLKYIQNIIFGLNKLFSEFLSSNTIKRKCDQFCSAKVCLITL